MVNTRFDDIGSEYDVLIVGAGTSGLMAANVLSSKFSVLVIDYTSMPRHKVCSGIIVKQGLDIIKELGLPSDIYKKPERIDITYLDWDNNKKFVTKKNFLNSDRELFDKWLFEKVSKHENVYICDQTRLIDFYIDKDNENTIAILKSEPDQIKSVETKQMIGSDGALSFVRRKLFGNNIPFYVAVKETIKSRPLDRAYFIFDKEVTDHYCWLIPKNGYVEIGAALNPHRSKEKFLIFKNRVREKFGISGDGLMESAIILRPDRINDIVLGEEGVLLVGEAAGLITPSGAEGISNALMSGKLAAESINEDMENAFFLYRKKCRNLLERFRRKIEKSNVLKDPSKRNEYFS